MKKDTATWIPLRFKKEQKPLIKLIEAEAQRNNRSRNAEIVHRLALSLQSSASAPG